MKKQKQNKNIGILGCQIIPKYFFIWQSQFNRTAFNVPEIILIHELGQGDTQFY